MQREVPTSPNSVVTWKLDPRGLPRVETEMLLADGPTRSETNGNRTDSQTGSQCLCVCVSACVTPTTHCRLVLSCRPPASRVATRWLPLARRAAGRASEPWVEADAALPPSSGWLCEHQ